MTDTTARTGGAATPLILILALLGGLYVGAVYVIGLPTFFVFEWIYAALVFLFF